MLDAPPLAMAIAFDPVLAGLQIIAQTADPGLLPRQGHRGFPHWGEWQESSGALDAALGGAGGVRGLWSALNGSPEVFGPGWEQGVPGSLAVSRPPYACINAISLERYGGNEVAAKAAIAFALLSTGTPMLTLEDAARHARFAGVLARLRRRWQAILQPPSHGEESAEGGSKKSTPALAPPTKDLRTIAYHGASISSSPDWDGSAAASGIPEAAYFAVSIASPAGAPAIYFGINTSIDRAVEVHLPYPPVSVVVCLGWRGLSKISANCS